MLLRDAINTIRSNSDIENATFCVLIGPEGDFSPEEVQLALQNGFQPVLLGNARLRTETAGVVGFVILSFV